MKQLRENWVIIVFLGGMIMTWSAFQSRLAQAEADIVDLKQVVMQINQINTNIAVIQEKISNIDNKLGK